MRLQKFRIKDNSGKWVYFTVFDGGIDITTHKKETLCQFTCLFDKNGVEIYEGDIIVSCVGNAVVEYDDKTVSFRAFTKGRFKLAFNSNRDKKNLEVVGNLLENPELLEG